MLYLETSLFGFCFGDEAWNVEKRDSVLKLFSQIKSGLMDGFISPIVIMELKRSPEPLAKKFFGLIEEFGIRQYSVDEEEVQSLAAIYIVEGVIPVRYENDAFHAAFAAVGGFDVLVTLNCVHLANEMKSRRIKTINYREGYTKELSIRTPMEVIDYEN